MSASDGIRRRPHLVFHIQSNDLENIQNCGIATITGPANAPAYLLLLIQTMGISRVFGQLYVPLAIEGWTPSVV